MEFVYNKKNPPSKMPREILVGPNNADVAEALKSGNDTDTLRINGNTWTYTVTVKDLRTFPVKQVPNFPAGAISIKTTV